MRISARRPPVLDRNTLADIQILGEETLRETVELFVADMAPRLKRLRVAAATRAAEQINREARGLKGGALGVGAARLAGLCAAIEQYARNGKASEAGILVHAVEPVFDEARRALEDLCGA